MVQEYNVCDFYYDTGVCQVIARSQIFEYFTLAVIAFNALWISIDTDNNTALTLAEAPPVFQVAENAFCVYFSFEWFVRFCSFRDKKNCLKDAWFIFDSALVTLMVMETWVLNLVLHFVAGGGASGGALGNTSVLKLFRLVRLTRMARMAKLLRAIPELIILIKGIAVASRSVVFTLMLLAVILYFFAIVFRQITDDTALGEALFPSVPDAMRSLLLDGVLPDQASIVNQCLDDSWILGILILLFVLLATLTVMNMLVGVLCEVVSVVSSVEKEELTVNYVKMRLMTLFRGADADNSMTINREEFSNLLTGKKEAALIIREIGVDVVGLVDFADFIFDEQEELSFGTFMELVLSLRGSNTSTVKDIIDLRKFILTNFKTELSKVKKTILKQMQKSITNNGQQLAKQLGNGNPGTALALPRPQPLDYSETTSFQIGNNHANVPPRDTPASREPSPQRVSPANKPQTPSLQDVRRVLLTQTPTNQKQRPSSASVSTSKKRTSVTAVGQHRPHSANARSRKWDNQAPPLPTFPQNLPTEEEAGIPLRETAPDRSKVGTASNRLRPDTR
jgi:hypothetical protein